MNIKPLQAIIDTLSAARTHGAERPDGFSPPFPSGRKDTATYKFSEVSPGCKLAIVKTAILTKDDWPIEGLRELSRIADRKADEMERKP